MPTRLRNFLMLFAAALGGAVIGGTLVLHIASEPPRPIFYAEDCIPPPTI
ncbi:MULTISPECIES: hypothetical protein [unclassified Pseudomonas]|nr:MULTISPECIES: hypothetical protein [unclassified Pseudomonas]MDG9928548.1 hypothetical protein [Pseudomonas sp. GD04042]MDH0482718.1 hypothetical protein [Pseudomonas sp. GD04015]MDH0604580.1 hypothetical protein [Pseudomonas sp. GD03869]